MVKVFIDNLTFARARTFNNFIMAKLSKKSKISSKNKDRKQEIQKPSLKPANNALKKPSKTELKAVISSLEKDSKLIKRALRYIPYYLKSQGLTKKLLKEIIRLWSEAGEKVRVVCLLCLIRIYTKLQDKELKQMVVKKLYSTFLDKCRITKHETMSMIGFMRHSLVELYKLDPQIAFKQAQTSCQQLSLTLKNALTHKNEETYKTVLNWQFANCLILLSNMIISHDDDSPVKSLAHQVIQLNLGALNFLTSPRYYPYYCHLIENLIGFCRSTSMFIPVMPHMLSILDKVHIPKPPKVDRENGDSESKQKKRKQNEKKRKNMSECSDDDEDKEDIEEEDEDDDEDEADDGDKKEKKEYNMELLNHVSLDEAHSLEYNVAVVDKIYELMLTYLASQCHKIAFPELVLLPCIQIKKWLKKNPGPHSQKFKTLLDKVKSDCEKSEEARRNVNFSFTNFTAVDAWEKRFRDSNKLSLPKLATNLSK